MTAFALNFFAVEEHDAGRRSVFHADLRDFCVAVRISAPACLRGCCHRLRDRPDAAGGEELPASRVRIRSCPNQQDQRASRRPWSQKRSENSARRDRRAQQIGFKILGDQVGDRHRPPAQQVVDIFLAEFADRAASLAACPTDRLSRARRYSGGVSFSASPITVPILPSDA